MFKLQYLNEDENLMISEKLSTIIGQVQLIFMKWKAKLQQRQILKGKLGDISQKKNLNQCKYLVKLQQLRKQE
ncbi:unnamed protein product [Paramecium sonneborni]|uniref:Uncharacterized protein n=1 Tax=Paramecium sonneborni TaxID=65129 RepID=A0A8S1RSI3_9CILI|nr:unnamed protein product [Paramecium sonneborni]